MACHWKDFQPIIPDSQGEVSSNGLVLRMVIVINSNEPNIFSVFSVVVKISFHGCKNQPFPCAQVTLIWLVSIWRYACADWEKACELIDNTNWDSLFSDDINFSWSNWQQQFMSIIEECIPKGVLPPRKNLPWLNKNLICAMKKRNQLYKKAKQTGDFSRYKLARNRAVSNLRREKKAYFGNLNPKNPKKFWKAVKYLNKNQCSIPTLSHNDTTVQTDIGKANLLNSFFSSCYNLSHSALDPFEYHHNLQPSTVICRLFAPWVLLSLPLHQSERGF